MQDSSRLRHLLVAGVCAAALATGATAARAGTAEAQKWIDNEFQPSTLSKADQMKEMEWFINAAKPYVGQEIHVVSETLDTHVYESQTLAKAFNEITGMHVIHDYIQEGDVVEKLQTEMQTGKPIYDMYINDSDHIGTHFRYGVTVPLSDFMAGEGKDVTLPTLDVNDFIGKSFTTAPDGKLYQLPDQQFANLYWFRADWFARPDLKDKFKAKYGYELGVPVNWSAYEDIADFFTNDVKELDGKRVYGHMDYGKKDPSLGWRFTDAWLSMAGEADKGIPNGLPVDEWGIRMENCHPVGASVKRGGGTNSAAAVYATTKYIEWMKKYAPPEAIGMTFSEAGPVPGQGQIAQQVFWYSAFTASSTKAGLPVMNADGTPKWRMAPSPHGPYWKDGMQNGYQDVGSWTMMQSSPLERRKAAWLYAQFVISKSVSLKKTIVGLTPIRERRHPEPGDDRPCAEAGRVGGVLPQPGPRGLDADRQQRARLPEAGPALVAARRGRRDRRADAAGGDGRAGQRHGQGHGAAGAGGHEELRAEAEPGDLGSRAWEAKGGAPWPKLANEKPPGETVPYDKLLTAWKEGRVR